MYVFSFPWPRRMVLALIWEFGEREIQSVFKMCYSCDSSNISPFGARAIVCDLSMSARETVNVQGRFGYICWCESCSWKKCVLLLSLLAVEWTTYLRVIQRGCRCQGAADTRGSLSVELSVPGAAQLLVGFRVFQSPPLTLLAKRQLNFQISGQKTQLL
jgi:hypothetical protein